MDFTIILNSLIVSGIGALLAASISIVDLFVNNYGEVNIDINDGKKILNVKGGSPLLFTLSDQGIFIPSACGGRGSCAMCKVAVKSDVGPILPTELPYLNEDEKNEGIRLSCQVKVKKDIKIKIPDELFNVRKYQCVVESIRDLTHDIKEIRIALPETENINFTAGQYIQFEAPPYNKIKDATQRAYSISSIPKDDKIIELIIRLVPGGIVTSYIFDELKEMQKINIVGPFGEFKMQETKADMICVAGGSGMAPIKSIINDMKDKGIADRNVWYFFGARSFKDLFYLKEFDRLEKELKNLRFIPALSEPAAKDSWTGETGIITDVLDKYLKTKIDKHSEKEGYLCGSPGMIDACVRVMTSNGIPENKIYYDKFA